jgi:hypothetical protein
LIDRCSDSAEFFNLPKLPPLDFGKLAEPVIAGKMAAQHSVLARALRGAF